MKGFTTALALGLVLTSSYAGEVHNQSNDSSWASLISRGHLPYRRLTVSDFRIDDTTRGEVLIYTAAFISYSYRTAAYPVKNGSGVRAVISEFDVKSGFDIRNSWRRSRLADPSRYLEHEQGHLIINEVAARQFSAFLSQKSLVAEGPTPREALMLLDQKVKLAYENIARQNTQDQARYDRETRGGDDRVAQARWSTALNRNLQALPKK